MSASCGVIGLKERSGYLFAENNAPILANGQHPGRNARVSLLDMVTSADWECLGRTKRARTKRKSKKLVRRP